MKTTEKLAAALTEAGAPVEMIDAARRGEYDDFESESAMPLNDLVRDCRAVGLENIARRAINGDFDGSTEESRAWFEREGKHLLGGV